MMYCVMDGARLNDGSTIGRKPVHKDQLQGRRVVGKAIITITPVDENNRTAGKRMTFTANQDIRI